MNPQQIAVEISIVLRHSENEHGKGKLKQQLIETELKFLASNIHTIGKFGDAGYSREQFFTDCGF